MPNDPRWNNGSRIPSELSLCWKELQVGWKEALDVWVIGDSGAAAPINAIAERTVRKLYLPELDALIRHLSIKMGDAAYIRLLPGYSDFWEIWTIAAIREQGRQLGLTSKSDTPPER